jgi:hypothetical protein
MDFWGKIKPYLPKFMEKSPLGNPVEDPSLLATPYQYSSTIMSGNAAPIPRTPKPKPTGAELGQEKNKQGVAAANLAVFTDPKAIEAQKAAEKAQQAAGQPGSSGSSAAANAAGTPDVITVAGDNIPTDPNDGLPSFGTPKYYNPVADYGIGANPRINTEKTGLPPGAPYHVQNTSPMGETERLTRLADRLNNRLYYRPSTRAFDASGNSSGERAEWYHYPSIETEDTRQQETDRGLREKSNAAQRELEAEMNKRQFDLIAKVPEWAAATEQKKIDLAVELGADIASWQGNKSQQELFLNAIDQFNKFIDDQYSRGLLELQQRYNISNKALDNYYTQAQEAFRHGLTMEQLGYSTDLQKALTLYADLGVKQEKMRAFNKAVVSGADAVTLDFMAKAYGIEGGFGSDAKQFLKNLVTTRIPVVQVADMPLAGETPLPPGY